VEFETYRHDQGAKEVLGQVIPAIPKGVAAAERERMGREELDRVLDIVALHPATARHIATKLCRRFIADDPPTGAVAEVADAFLRARGDIPATLRVVFATSEFQTQRGAKFRRPFNFIVAALRATNAETDANPRVIDYLHSMGHAPFHFPTPDGYPEEATPWLGTLLWRWNFAVAADGEPHQGHEDRPGGADRRVWRRTRFDGASDGAGGDGGGDRELPQIRRGAGVDAGRAIVPNLLEFLNTRT